MTTAVSDAAKPLRTIGPYRLENRLGSGGMGVVYEALQMEPVQRRVALKLLRFDMDTDEVVARFEQERQALAVMDHPNIAKVLDAGSSDDKLPFFVMELVAGARPINEYCNRERLATRARLLLFQQLCEAVQHAHLKGVVHRDLKPSNVLVTEVDGKPHIKVIDFGIAKAIGVKLSQQVLVTRMDATMGTPAYMSPEQADTSTSDIDSRSDIYSMGVLLYQLLTGLLPFDPSEMGVDRWLNRLARGETNATTPSSQVITARGKTNASSYKGHETQRQLHRLLRGDLDHIVLKAMAPERSRRYATAEALGEDIQNFLDHQPVSARAPTAGYRLSRFLRRHRLGVAMAAVVFSSIAIGLMVALNGLHRAQSAQSVAQQEATASKEVVQFLVTLLGSADPQNAAGRQITVAELVDQGANRLDTSLLGQPLVRARLAESLATVYIHLAKLKQAERLLDSAQSWRIEQSGADNPGLVDTWYTKAMLHRARAEYSQAITLLNKALRVIGHPATVLARQRQADIEHDLGVVLDESGDSQQARRIFEQALAQRKLAYGAGSQQVATTLNSLGNVAWSQGDRTAAERYFQSALDIKQARLQPNSPALANSLSNLAVVYHANGRMAQAETLFQTALAIVEKAYGPDHPAVADILSNLAQVYEEQHQFARAEPMYRRALDIVTRHLGGQHPDVGLILHNLATLLLEQGHLQQAEELSQRARTIFEQALQPEHIYRAYAYKQLGDIRFRQQRLHQADAAYQRSVAIFEKNYGVDNPALLEVLEPYLKIQQARAGSDEQQTKALRNRIDQLSKLAKVE